MPDINHDEIGAILGRRRAAKLELQKMAKKIEEDWGNLARLPPDIARSWQVVQAYIRDCIWIHWPVPLIAPDWKTIANAEAQFESFTRKIRETDHWKEISFPLADFCSAWDLARKDFMSELVEWAPESQASLAWCRFVVYPELLFEEETTMPDKPSLCSVNVIAYDDSTRIYGICYTGSTRALPEELKHLDLNEVATGDLVAISDLRSKVRTNISVFKKAQERALAMFRLPASGPPDPQSTSLQSTSSVQSTLSRSTSSDSDATDR
jgi:hypothetical protein